MELIRSFVAMFPLALIISQQNDQWCCSQIPVFFDESAETLFAHVDAKNTQFSGASLFRAQLVFMGPNVYIPPDAYASPQLPTWNYLAVHASVNISVINDVIQNIDILQKTALQLGPASSSFRVQESDTRIAHWIGGIRGLRIEVFDIEGRFKLSQDKKPEDVYAAARYFADVVSTQITPEVLLTYSGLKNGAEEAL